MLWRLRVHTECFEFIICCPRKPLPKRLSKALQLTQNGSSLCYSSSSPLMPNKNDLPGKSIKQNTKASCSRVAMPTIWCILNAQTFAWLLFGAHWMLECFELEISCPRKPLSKRLSNALQLTQNGSSLCYPFASPRMQNKNALLAGSIKQNARASCSRDANAMAINWCILDALAFAWRLCGAN